MKQYREIFLQNPLFATIREEELQQLLQCLNGRVRSFVRGERIMQAGETIHSVGLVLEGQLHIQREDYWGRLNLLQSLEPGDLFGEVYAIPGSQPMLHDVLATQKGKALMLEIKSILTPCCSVCSFHQQLMQNLYGVLANKNRTLTQKVWHLSQRSTREKLLSYLSEQARRAGSASFAIPFNRQQLADFLSVDRSAMSNELCKMRDEGLILFEKNQFTLLPE